MWVLKHLISKSLKIKLEWLLKTRFHFTDIDNLATLKFQIKQENIIYSQELLWL